MTCPDGETLSAYADGELGGAFEAEVAAHLEACPSCAAEVQSLSEVGHMAREAIAAIPADNVSPVFEVPTGTTCGRRRLPWMATAAAVLIAAAGLLVWRLETGKQPIEAEGSAKPPEAVAATGRDDVGEDGGPVVAAASDTPAPRPQSYADSVWEEVERRQRARAVAMRMYGIGTNGTL